MNETLDEILDEIRSEREHQDKIAEILDGGIDDSHSRNDWAAFIVRYVGLSLSGGKGSKDKMFRYQMIKVAAIVVAAVQAIDRKTEKK